MPKTELRGVVGEMSGTGEKGKSYKNEKKAMGGKWRRGAKVQVAVA